MIKFNDKNEFVKDNMPPKTWNWLVQWGWIEALKHIWDKYIKNGKK